MNKKEKKENPLTQEEIELITYETNVKYLIGECETNYDVYLESCVDECETIDDVYKIGENTGVINDQINESFMRFLDDVYRNCRDVHGLTNEQLISRTIDYHLFMKVLMRKEGLMPGLDD